MIKISASAASCTRFTLEIESYEGVFSGSEAVNAVKGDFSIYAGHALVMAKRVHTGRSEVGKSGLFKGRETGRGAQLIPREPRGARNGATSSIQAYGVNDIVERHDRMAGERGKGAVLPVVLLHWIEAGC
jgi:hypothetical protein